MLTISGIRPNLLAFKKEMTDAERLKEAQRIYDEGPGSSVEVLNAANSLSLLASKTKNTKIKEKISSMHEKVSSYLYDIE